MTLLFLEFYLSYGRPGGVPARFLSTGQYLGLYIADRRHTAMPPKKKPKPPSWVASTAAPPKPKVPRVTVLNLITSSDWKGIFFTVEGNRSTRLISTSLPRRTSAAGRFFFQKAILMMEPPKQHSTPLRVAGSYPVKFQTTAVLRGPGLGPLTGQSSSFGRVRGV